MGFKKLNKLDFGTCIQFRGETNINRLLIIAEKLKCVKYN